MERINFGASENKLGNKRKFKQVERPYYVPKDRIP